MILKAASRGMLGDEVALYFGVIVTFGRVRNFETTCLWDRKFAPIWHHSRVDLRHLECEDIKSLKIWGWYTVVWSPKFFIECFGTVQHVFKPSQNSKILIYEDHIVKVGRSAISSGFWDVTPCLSCVFARSALYVETGKTKPWKSCSPPSPEK